MALVIADPVAIPHKDIPDVDIVYVRLHGSPEMYKSSYSDDTLLSIAELLADQARTTSNVWCVFDNTMDGAAICNALTLRKIWQQSSPRSGQL
jgi:uncharacterized protein YecE (DUF72 family)